MKKNNMISVKFCQRTWKSPNPDLKAKDKGQGGKEVGDGGIGIDSEMADSQVHRQQSDCCVPRIQIARTSRKR